MEISLDVLKQYMTPDKFSELMIRLEKDNKAEELRILEEKKEKKRKSMAEYRAKKKAKKQKSEFNKEENEKVMAYVKEQIESFGLVYKKCSTETTYAQCIRTGKEFTQTAEKYKLSSNLELCMYVIKASMMDKYWCGKITNCKDLYLNYPKIINAFQVNKTKAVNSIGFLPGA